MAIKAVQIPAVLRNRPLVALSMGHFTVDMYVGILPMLYPLLIDRFTLDFKTVGLVSLAYTGGASLAQPLFGWLADRYGTRLIGLALVWTTMTFALLGFIPSFPALLGLALISGLGSAMYHPFGAVNAGAVIGEGQRNTAMSVYVTGGTIGVATGPLLGALVFPIFGLAGTAIIFIPSICLAIWLLFEMRSGDEMRARVQAAQRAEGTAPIPYAALAVIVLLMMTRAWPVVSVNAYIPTWYDTMGYSPAFYGALVTTFTLASAVGTLLIGALADRHGARVVIVGAAMLTLVAVLLIAAFPGPFAFAAAMLFGAAANSTNPLLLILAQRLMRGRAGMASGVILGLGFITGAIGVPITGALADNIGFQGAMAAQSVVIVASILFALLLPRERYQKV